MVSVLGIGLVLLGACGNKQFFDTTYTFNYAMVKLPDGTTVLVNSTNAVLSVDQIK